MNKIIIGIHGLGNKPSPFLLERWWRKSILEGLNRIGRKRRTIPFELVYWADILYPRHLRPSIKDPCHPLYLDEHYRPGEKPPFHPATKTRSKWLKTISKQLDRVFLNSDMTLNFERIADKIISRYFKDLETYYASKSIIKSEAGRPARETIRDRLAAILLKYRHKDILLVAHSMGSIIAYDVLSQTLPEIKLHTLVTIGSPLGLPIIVSRIFFEQKRVNTDVTCLKVPDNISNGWYNLADVEDKVALDQTLADDYSANVSGVSAMDMEVANDYEMDGVKNSNKSFGYLRTLEMAFVIDRFLGRKEPSWIVKRFRSLKQWIQSKLSPQKDIT